MFITCNTSWNYIFITFLIKCESILITKGEIEQLITSHSMITEKHIFIVYQRKQKKILI